MRRGDRLAAQATTLDETFTGHEQPIRLLHIYAEAWEPKIIAGAHNFIERHCDIIVVLEVGEAFRNRKDDSLRAALEYLEGTGRIFCLIRDNRPQISVNELMESPLANAAAIPRHLANA